MLMLTAVQGSAVPEVQAVDSLWYIIVIMIVSDCYRSYTSSLSILWLSLVMILLSI